MSEKDTPKLHPSWEWSLLPQHAEVFTEPSMVEPVHNLTIEEILRDYSRGIVHSSYPAMFDDGDDVEEVDLMDDILDLKPDSLHGTTHTDSDPDPDLTLDVPDPFPPVNEE